MGFPSPAADYVEIGLNWNEYLIQHPAATFPVRAAGKSMEPLIAEGAYVIVDRSLDPKNNDIIIAIYREEFMLKRFVKNSKGTFLLSENPKFSPIQIKNEDDFQMWGVVTFSITNHRAV